MTALFDIFQLTVIGTLLGQDVRNVFHYQYTQSGSSPNSMSQTLAEAWEAEVKPDILPLTHQDMVYERTVTQNLNDIVDASDDPIALGAGLITTGEVMPSYVAWSFQLKPFSKLVRHGRKSFAGVAEVSAVGNDPSPTALGDIAILALRLATPLTAPTGEQFFPVVASIPPAATIPFIPVSVGIQEAVYRRIGTQNSRKVGAGS